MLGQQGPLWLFLDKFTNIFTKILNIQEDLEVEEKQPIYYNSSDLNKKSLLVKTNQGIVKSMNDI